MENVVWEIIKSTLCEEGKQEITESVGLVGSLKDYFNWCRKNGYTHLTCRGMTVPEGDSSRACYKLKYHEFIT